MVLTLKQLGLNIINQWLFKNISMTILPGTLLYIKGDNGAGKTCLLRIIASIMKPSVGDALVNNVSVDDLNKPYAVYIGHNLALKPYLSVYENLFRDSLYYNSSERIYAALKYFKLDNLCDLVCDKLSAGKQKKLALSRLLACSSQIWLLDEVMTNLDQEGKTLVKNCVITHLMNNGIAVVCDHDFDSNYNDLSHFTLTLNLLEYTQ